jgi:hypothetical protein
MTDRFARYLCMSIDVEGYGRADDRRQSAVQEELLGLLGVAAEAASLDRRTWTRQGKGDEELALIPATESEPRVVDDFVRELATALWRRNCDRTPAERLRLRLALDHGLVKSAANGFAGRPVVAVSRLVNSQPVRRALAVTDANLAVILSRRVYADVVLGGHTQLPPAAFREVPVREKELAEEAWLRVPGLDVHQLPLTGAGDAVASDADARPEPAGQRGVAAAGSAVNQAGRDLHVAATPVSRVAADGEHSQVVVNEFAGPVDASGGVIGIRNGR